MSNWHTDRHMERITHILSDLVDETKDLTNQLRGINKSLQRMAGHEVKVDREKAAWFNEQMDWLAEEARREKGEQG